MPPIQVATNLVIIPLSRLVGLSYGTVLGLVMRDRGGCPSTFDIAHAERQLQHLPAATAAAAVVVSEAITPSRPEGLAARRRFHCRLLPLHLAYKAGPSATYDVTAYL